MSKDQFQDKYNEIFQSIKEEKMDWDFNDFLDKAEGKPQDDTQASPVIPIGTKTKPSFPKWFWMAAAVVLLAGTGFVINYFQQTDINDRAKLVEHQIKQQKNAFIEENNEHQEQVAVNAVSDSVSGTKKDSVFQENSIAENDVMDNILSKRGRLKKEKKPKFVHNAAYTPAKDSTGYKDNYVIVNGKRIENVEEAINVTKYSFQVFANHVSEKLGQPEVVDDNY
ncbi:hypothetical protein [uncultured Chryseobacterium sp.]|uniref:hypothetical protein n=1 Tax=uncultured Chryseobacterium sp. TaxID=259322 RepID=UPI0025D0BE86|nr:hypothetical protein [uncultured Chryseobacterium sp.]